MAEIRIGTRGSRLALWQAETVAARIADAGGPPCRIVIIKTSGDRLQEAPLSEVGGKRLFVKEIEDALLSNEVDLAVHSSKDMPAVLPDGLAIGGVLPREDPHDAVVLPATPGSGPSTLTMDDVVRALGGFPSIGTSSVRRIAQLAELFRGARFGAIRGNLDTRLRKLDDGAYDALVLAAAGLRRLGFASRISFTLPVSACVPAPGQGIVAMEMRQDDVTVGEATARINDEQARAAFEAERAVVEALGGGCQMPIGALAVSSGDRELDLVATVLSLDGKRAIRATARGNTADARQLGRRAAEDLIAQGADDMLRAVSSQQSAVSSRKPGDR